MQNAVLFHIVNNNWTITEFLHISKTKYPFWMYPYKLWFHCPLTIQKAVSQKSQNRLFFIKKIYHKKGNRIGVHRSCRVKLSLNQIRRFPQGTVCQSRYMALSCKISLLSRQQTTKALIRLRGGAAWSAPLWFTYDKSRFSHDVAPF